MLRPWSSENTFYWARRAPSRRERPGANEGSEVPGSASAYLAIAAGDAQHIDERRRRCQRWTD